MADRTLYSGIDMGNDIGGGAFSTKNVIEDFMKTEYQEGLRNEFNMMEALINKLPKDTITGKVKYKSFALGITDNIRAVGKDNYDRYELGMDEFWGQGADSVEAQFGTTKVMATFGITDEAILKGTGDGSLIDVLHDSLNRMEIGLKHTMNRYTYGGKNGIIGKIKSDIATFSLASVTKDAKDEDEYLMDYRGKAFNNFYGNAPKMVTFSFTNSHSLIEGMGCMVDIITTTAVANSTTPSKGVRYVGKIWQKDNTSVHSEKVIMVVEKSYTGTYSSTTGKMTWTKDSTTTVANTTYVATATTSAGATLMTVYSRQLNDGGEVAAEYTGLEDIVCTQNNTLFGVDRNVYRSLNCTAVDLGGTKYLNEETLRDLADHLALTSPEGTSITLCCANHRIISQVEKQMYQFKNFNLTTTAQGMNLGGGANEVRFDNFVLYKDKYARDNNVYMLDQNKIGELVRRDFTWITSGEVNGVLQRRPGTEMYEGIMNKYADMYIDAWRCHAVIKDCAVVAPGTFFSYQSDGTPKIL